MKQGIATRLEKLESRKPAGRPFILWAGDAQEFERAQVEEQELKAQGKEALLVSWQFSDDKPGQ